VWRALPSHCLRRKRRLLANFFTSTGLVELLPLQAYVVHQTKILTVGAPFLIERITRCNVRFVPEADIANNSLCGATGGRS